MKRIILVLLFIIVTCAPARAEDIAVIVNQANQNSQISTKQLIDLYMGKLIAFPNGSSALPLDLNPSSMLREQFYETLTKRPIGSINAYWSRVKFGGRARPPESLDSTQAVIKRVIEIDNAIGYVKLSEVTNDVKVIYILAE